MNKTEVRQATEVELEQLREYHRKTFGVSTEEFDPAQYSIVVIDNYVSESPGYAGRIMFAVFCDINYHAVYGWDSEGKLFEAKENE